MLTKVTAESALNAERDEHLGYRKNSKSTSRNSRNGYANKTIVTEDGAIDIEAPRDRLSTFEPPLVKKQQTRFTSMGDKIPSLNAKAGNRKNLQ
ncbi:transposase [Pseudoalteromonas luteoviolacea]|uniref:Mutator family transposase n=1 Tax=Pseudoalteromonas luteoviolacea (strain 2ta16) TaxID=1353533 RepID=V4HVA2_PSEL2|nr:transposase [Pseudoalteromonas luteoviolacea 2ta16]KZN41157.1 hypothetical protein N483_16225 [Pseudoalteromonas luteoviolacea NCIMB 1944]